MNSRTDNILLNPSLSAIPPTAILHSRFTHVEKSQEHSTPHFISAWYILTDEKCIHRGNNIPHPHSSDKDKPYYSPRKSHSSNKNYIAIYHIRLISTQQ